MLQINDLTRLYLGIQGENGVRTITVDVSPWIELYPNGSVTVWHTRNGDESPSATGAVYDSDTKTVTWAITSVDTFVAGIGDAEFRLIENTVIKKTVHIMTGVSPSVTLAGTELGSDWASYINAVDGLRAAAVTAKLAAEDAQTAAETAQGKAEDAQEAAEGAQTAAETAQGKAEDAQTAAEEAADRAEHASKVMVPAGGTEGQRLAKKSGTDFDMEWKTDPYYTKPEGGIPASDMAEGAIPDPEDLIDDTAGEGDTDKTWSADKLTSDVLSAIDKLTPDATASDIGKALIVKTVADGKPSSYEYGEAGGGGAVIDDTAGAGDTDKAWSADKIVTEIQQIIVSGGVPIDDTAGEGDIDKLWSADKNAKEFAKVGDNLAVEGKTMAARTFTGGGYRRTTAGGSFDWQSSTDYYTTNLIELPEGATSVIIRHYRPGGNTVDTAKGWSVVNFFNSSQAVISNQINLDSASADSDYVDKTYNVPSGAKYVSFITGASYRAEARCQVGTTEETLAERVGIIENIVRNEETLFIDESTLTTGVFYRDGGINSSVAYRTTDYIPCTQGDIFEITSLGVGTTWMWQVGYYDSSKNCITYAYKGTGTSSLVTFNAEVPYSNAKYIRISFYVDNGGTLSVVKKSIAKNDTPLVVTLNKQSLDDALGAGITKGRFTNVNNPDAFMLLHFSDIHGTAQNLKDISSVRSYLSTVLDDTLCTGDIMASNYSNSFDFWDDCSDGTILTCIGNHDVKAQGAGGTGYLTNQQTEATLYGRYMENYISNWGTVEHSDTNLYYYKDYPTKKIRLIVLNLLYPTEAKVTEQNTWLASALAGAKSAGYGVVIGEHYYPVSGTRIDCTFSALYNFPTSMGDPENYMYNGDALTTYQATVQDFIDGGGNFVCWLCGHKHADYIVYHPTYPKQVFIGVGGALFTDRAHELDHTSDMRRVRDTRSQNCMNVLSIDPLYKIIKIIRIGCDRDYLGRHRGALTLDYSTSPATVVYND